MKKILLLLLMSSPAFALSHHMRFVDPTMPCTVADVERNQKGIEPDENEAGCVIIFTPASDSAKVSEHALFYKHQEAATWWTAYVNDQITKATDEGKWDVTIDVTVAHREVVEYLRAALHNDGYRTSVYINGLYHRVHPDEPTEVYLEIEWGIYGAKVEDE